MPPSESAKDQLLRPVLQRLQECIQNHQYAIRDSRKNKNTLAHFGWTIENQETILLSLKPSDCYKVDNDLDQPDSEEFVYKFHKGYDEHLLYIKMTFRIIKDPDGQTDFAYIMSLHLDDYE